MADPFAAYLPHIRRRLLEEQADWQRRRDRAWESARRAADILRSDFAAQEVIAFGSLVRSGPFDERSDIDLAVTGIEDSRFFRAWADAAAVVGEFELDLVDLADCSLRLREVILSEGVPL